MSGPIERNARAIMAPLVEAGRVEVEFLKQAIVFYDCTLRQDAGPCAEGERLRRVVLRFSDSRKQPWHARLYREGESEPCARLLFVAAWGKEI